MSPELLAILADPGDKGPVELVADGEGKEWLINRRNGYRYPVEDGIPIMLIEEGEKHKDTNLIAR
ncbi:MAG: Trm112 family protein [Roseiflexaceae bacterium]|nr:Trm112 family protein [Roseiflexaceae bacterium]